MIDAAALRRSHFVLTGCIFLIAIAGCDLLQTRDAQQPLGSGSTFVDPTTRDLVIANLQAAIAEKNSINYRKCLVDSNFSDREFQFQPTPEAVARYGNVFNGWSVVSEVQYFASLSSSRPEGTSSLSFSNPLYSNQSADEVVFTAKYHLIFQHQNSSLPPQEARGNVQFSVVRDSRSWWSIYQWIDVRDTSEITWSDFKGAFR